MNEQEDERKVKLEGIKRVEQLQAKIAQLKWLLREATQYVPEAMLGEISNAVDEES